MPEEGTGKTTSAGTEKTPPAEGTSGTQTGQKTEESNNNTKAFTQEDVDRLVGKARREEKAKYDKQAQDASKSELEKATNRITELETQIRMRDARDSVVEALSKAGCNNAAAAYRLVSDQIEFDKQGKPENLRELIAEAKALAPQLFGAAGGKSDGGAGGQSGTGGRSMNDLIRQAAGRL